MRIPFPCKTSVVAAALSAISMSAFAVQMPTVAITVDGNLFADWGVVLTNDVATSNLQPNVASTGAGSPACQGGSPALNSFYRCEDTNDSAGSGGLVTPLYGGQNYDVEFLGMARQGNVVYFGIATGQRPDNGFANYSPGDLFVKINGAQYVIEMGGGTGGNPGTVGPQVSLPGVQGQNYTVAGAGTVVTGSGGQTTAVTTFTDQLVGSVWLMSQGTTSNGIGYGAQIAGATTPVQFDATTGQVQKGQALVYATLNSLATTGTSGNNTHAVWEVGLNLAAISGLSLSGTYTIEAYWGPGCYNDVLAIAGEGLFTSSSSSSSSSSGQGSSGSGVPEAPTLALMGLALLGLGFAGRRRQQD